MVLHVDLCCVVLCVMVRHVDLCCVMLCCASWCSILTCVVCPGSSGAADRGEGPGGVLHAGLPEGGVRGGVPRRPAPDPRRQEAGGRVRPEPRHRLLHVLLPVPRQDLLVTLHTAWFD